MQYIKNFFKYVKEYSKYVDFTIIITYVLLALIGLIMIYSASMVSASRSELDNPEHFYLRQLLWMAPGFLIVFFMTYFMSGEFLKNKKLQITLVVGSLIVLLFTHFFGVEVNGERNWIQISFFRIQPSEFFKIVVILYLAYIYNRKRVFHNSLRKDIVMPLFFIAAISLLVLFNDFGTWMVLLSMMVGMFFYSGAPLKFVFKTGGVVALGIGAIFGLRYMLNGSILSGYQQARIETFINPFTDPAGAGYQLTNSLISISHGGVTGTGLGNGVMKLGYLPEPHTDFIFAVIAEELGLIGVIVILILYMVLIFKALYYAGISTDKFYSLIAAGVAIYLSIQVFVNLGGISKLIPLTGVPLPLLSYGGSSFLSISIAIGLLIIAAKHVKRNRETL